MADTPELPSYSCKSIKAAPIKRVGDDVLVLDLGDDRELRVRADPAVMDTHTPPQLGDFYIQAGDEDGAGVVMGRYLFETLFGAEAVAEQTETQRPATGPVPADALGLTTQSLEDEEQQSEGGQSQEELEELTRPDGDGEATERKRGRRG